MPELPEVEAARRAIEENCLNKKIVKAIIADDPKVIDAVSPSDFEASVVGKTIVAACRKGKNLWLQFDSPPCPAFQFGMTGAFYIKGVAVTKYKRSAVNDTDEWPSKFSKFFIQLDDGLEVSFTDKRRFAKVRLLKDPSIVPPISELGPDALLELMTVDAFIKCLSKKKTSIKALLLDQGFISGIGNWVADEVLYQAKIHPMQTAASLSKESCMTLHSCIKEVIEKAVEVGADSSQYPSDWIYHSRDKKPGKAFVDGKKIDFITAGGRTSAYVPELQKLTGTQATQTQGKLRKQSSKRKKGDDNDEDGEVDEPANEEEESTDSVKSVKPTKGTSSRGAGKKAPRKRKTKESDDDDQVDPESEGEEDDEIAKPKNTVKAGGGRKKPSQASKAKQSSNHNSDDAESGDKSKDEDEDDQKEKMKTAKTTKTQKTSTKKVETKKTPQPKKAK